MANFPRGTEVDPEDLVMESTRDARIARYLSNFSSTLLSVSKLSRLSGPGKEGAKTCDLILWRPIYVPLAFQPVNIQLFRMDGRINGKLAAGHAILERSCLCTLLTDDDRKI